MQAQERGKFLVGYTKILNEAWSGDAGFVGRLSSDPDGVARDHGLDPGSAKVNIITQAAGEASLDKQIELWETGKAAGSIDLYVPLSKPDDMADYELSEEQLEGVAGGGDTYCCCCSPCCSC